MSYSGTDPSLHRHSIPNQLERYLNLDFELGAYEQKVMAGVVKGEDTLDAAIQFGQAYGRHPSNSSRPTLTSPMWSLRISAPDIQPPPEMWGATFEHLVKLLPEEVKTKLLIEMDKPFAERQPAFTALQGLLETAAKFLTMIALANKEIDPTGPAAQKREEYLQVPLEGLKNLSVIAKDVLEQAQNLLKGVP